MLNINHIEWEKVTSNDVKEQIAKTETDENFFFEFKSARETPSKMMKEVSAFANTFGGYIFIGVENDKTITGRGEWTEERLHTTIHDSITPTPIFDVKEFTVDNQSILVVRIEEGAMPPYIVNDGRIYERISSGSFPIKDSAKLNQLIIKRNEFDKKVASVIELDPIDLSSRWCPQNICAYIDVGFYIMCRDELRLIKKQEEKNILEKVAAIISDKKIEDFEISIVGNRILITFFHFKSYDDNGNEIPMVSGIQHFIEIMNDGSVRFRIILATDKDKQSASITGIGTLVYLFQEVYSAIVGDDFDKTFVYARKYEKLTVLRQFAPYYELDQLSDKMRNIYKKLEREHKVKYGNKNIAIGNRFPSNGYLMYDKISFDKFGVKWSTENIVLELISTVFINLGFVELPKLNTN